MLRPASLIEGQDSINSKRQWEDKPINIAVVGPIICRDSYKFELNRKTEKDESECVNTGNGTPAMVKTVKKAV